MSIGLVRVPAASIFNFSQMWGSGTKGASPSVKQRITSTQTGIDWISDHMIFREDLWGHDSPVSYSSFISSRDAIELRPQVFIPA